MHIHMVIVNKHTYHYVSKRACVISNANSLNSRPPPVPCGDSEERGIQAEADQDVIGPHQPTQCSGCQVGGMRHGIAGLDRKKKSKTKHYVGVITEATFF